MTNRPRVKLNPAETAMCLAALEYAHPLLGEVLISRGMQIDVAKQAIDDARETTETLMTKLRYGKKCHINQHQVAISMAALEIAFKTLTNKGEDAPARIMANDLITRMFDFLANQRGKV